MDARWRIPETVCLVPRMPADVPDHLQGYVARLQLDVARYSRTLTGRTLTLQAQEREHVRLLGELQLKHELMQAWKLTAQRYKARALRAESALSDFTNLVSHA